MLCILYSMSKVTENWKTQIRKGYLELCILMLIRRYERLYGFELLERLSKAGLDVKEGTAYPLLNRMTLEGYLSSVWETENIKGHPRKFYSLTREGRKMLYEMAEEFDQMVRVFKGFEKGN